MHALDYSDQSKRLRVKRGTLFITQMFFAAPHSNFSERVHAMQGHTVAVRRFVADLTFHSSLNLIPIAEP